jgi:hypothetical protein
MNYEQLARGAARRAGPADDSVLKSAAAVLDDNHRPHAAERIRILAEKLREERTSKPGVPPDDYVNGDALLDAISIEYGGGTWTLLLTSAQFSDLLVLLTDDAA